uniref:Uncharacterized protein n=1 Tax=Opuntia streptacantha TaxID=393608 RepID=A0A7C9C9U2_OPUST
MDSNHKEAVPPKTDAGSETSNSSISSKDVFRLEVLGVLISISKEQQLEVCLIMPTRELISGFKNPDKLSASIDCCLCSFAAQVSKTVPPTLTSKLEECMVLFANEAIVLGLVISISARATG